MKRNTATDGVVQHGYMPTPDVHFFKAAVLEECTSI